MKFGLSAEQMADKAKKKNIVVTNTPDVLTDATAEIAMLILLGAARRAKEGIEWANKKNWKWSADFLMGKQLTGARLGILGMGRIGRAVANIARSFGMIIHYHNRSQLDKNLEKGAIYHNSLESLLSVSDFFSINCPATKETKHIINKETLNYFPDGAIISNTGHYDCEINIEDLEGLAASKRTIRDNNNEYTMNDGRKIFLLADGRLVNLAAAEGHPSEVMDMSFANQYLALCRLAEEGKDMQPIVYDITVSYTHLTLPTKRIV